METWALLIDWIGNEFADEVTRLVQNDCRRNGRSLVVFTLGSLSYHLPEGILEEQVGRVLRSPRLDRILWSAGQIVRGGGDIKLTSILRRMPVRPTLTLGARIGRLPFLEVRHSQAFRVLLDHLWDGHGYRSYAWVGGPPDNPVAQARRQVFLRFLNDRGAELRPDLDCPGDFNLSAGREAGGRLLPLVSEFDAVVAANDAMAVGVGEVLGPSVPVTGFDNHPSAARAGLSTVDSEVEKEVLAALRCLESLGQEGGEPDPLNLGRLVLRSSCGCPALTPVPPAPEPATGSAQRVGPLFDAILGSRDLSELADGLNRALPAENVGYWRVLAAGGGDFWPEGADSARLELVVHSLFREEELFGYLVHDLTNQNYTFSEWLRINLSLTFAGWHRQSSRLQVQILLQREIDRFARRQREVEGVIDSLPVWMVELDRRLHLRYGNLAWKSLLGLPASARAGGAFLETVAPEDRERVGNRLLAALRSHEKSAADFRFQQADGRKVAVLGGIDPLAEEGGPQLAPLFGSLHGAGGLRLAGVDLSALVAGVLQPEELLLKHFPLSTREQEVLAGTSRGLDSHEVAGLLGISPATVRVVLHNLYTKTGVANKKELLDLLADYQARTPRAPSLTQVLLARFMGGY